jgi:glycosyltransferase involved in cell wall biosynthesis
LNVGNFVSHNTEENVEYRLHVSDPALLALYYSAADVLLFTSIAENFPLVILEALSCGLPIVTFDVGGVKEAVSHLENGFLCPYTDTSALLEGLKWALNLNNEEHEVIAKQSHELVKTKFSVNLMTQQYLNLYLELIKKHD